MTVERATDKNTYHNLLGVNMIVASISASRSVRQKSDHQIISSDCDMPHITVAYTRSVAV